MDFYEVLEGRRSVRRYSDRPVSHDVLERVVRAAELAPSSMNQQPWTFHVCSGQTRVAVGEIIAQTTVHLTEYMDVLGPERYEEAIGWYTSLGDAPVIMVVTMPATHTEFDELNRTLSVGCAIENLLLAATAEELGSCNITFAFWVADEMKELLGVDDEERLAAVIAIGHPAERPAATPRRTDDVFWHR